MNPHLIPDHILPFCRKSNVHEWRNILPDKQVLCTHRSPGLLPDFIPRATDGIHTVVELIHNQSLHRIHSTNVIWPEKPKGHKAEGKIKATSKVKKTPVVIDLDFPQLTPEQLKKLSELINL